VDAVAGSINKWIIRRIAYALHGPTGRPQAEQHHRSCCMLEFFCLRRMRLISHAYSSSVDSAHDTVHVWPPCELEMMQTGWVTMPLGIGSSPAGPEYKHSLWHWLNTRRCYIQREMRAQLLTSWRALNTGITSTTLCNHVSNTGRRFPTRQVFSQVVAGRKPPVHLHTPSRWVLPAHSSWQSGLFMSTRLGTGGLQKYYWYFSMPLSLFRCQLALAGYEVVLTCIW